MGGRGKPRFSIPGKVYDPVYGVAVAVTGPDVPRMHSKVRTLADMTEAERRALSEHYGAPISPRAFSASSGIEHV